MNLKSQNVSAMIGIVLVTIGCGRAPEASQPQFDEGLVDQIKIFLAPSNTLSAQQLSNEQVLITSFPTQTQTASVCAVDLAAQDSCLPNTQQTLMKVVSQPATASQSQFFYSAIANISTYSAIKVFDAQSSSVFRTLKLKSGGDGKWKSIFMTGDYMDEKYIMAWDNGRRDLAAAMTLRGFTSAIDSKHLSMDPEVFNGTKDLQNGTKEQGVLESSLDNMENAYKDLNISDKDGCFVFMTSHGNKQGFHMEGTSPISPQDYTDFIQKNCGSKPVISLISACYAGVMLTDELKNDSSIMFTAASSELPSQGCEPGIEYNLFEECLLQTLGDGKVETFEQFGEGTKSCIEAKDRSDPIFYIGDKMKGLKLNGQIPF